MLRSRILALASIVAALTVVSTLPTRADIADYDVRVGVFGEITLDLPHRVSQPAAPEAAATPSASLQTTVIPGSAATLPTDGFTQSRLDASGLMTGRSAYVAPATGDCAGIGTADPGAERLLFDARPLRCGNVSARPFDFAAHR